MTERTLTFFIDFLCPYAWRFAELAEYGAPPLGYNVRSRHFSLYQHNYDGVEFGPDWAMWNQRLGTEDDDGVKGLLPFLAATAARRQGDQYGEQFRLTLQRLRHVEHQPFVLKTIDQAAYRAGLDMDAFARDLADPELPMTLAHEHTEATRLHVAGTPTVMLDDGTLAYVRLDEIPANKKDYPKFLEGIIAFMQTYPEVATLRRARPPAN